MFASLKEDVSLVNQQDCLPSFCEIEPGRKFAFNAVFLDANICDGQGEEWPFSGYGSTFYSSKLVSLSCLKQEGSLGLPTEYVFPTPGGPKEVSLVCPYIFQRLFLP